MVFEVVAEGLRFPEGPVAMPDGTVLVCEMVGPAIARVHSDGRVERIADIKGGPNGAALGPDGALYICNNGGGYAFEVQDGVYRVEVDHSRYVGGSLQRLDLHTGRLETLYSRSDARELVAPNDLVLDRQGGIWFTDYGAFTETGRTYGSIHYAASDGSSIECRRRGILSPNGIGLSPDEATLYTADTFAARLWAFDIEAPGRLAPANQRHASMPGRLVQTLPGFQLLDSMAVEAGGQVCVGTLLPGGITVFNLDGSTEFVPAPDTRITNLCFGGADHRDVWLTAATTGKLLKGRWSRPGLPLNFS